MKADLKPKKLSMMAAAVQVLQLRKVPMTCPDIIDVLATEDLWVPPGGKTPAATLYAAISRSIKDLGKASQFKKVGRGLFEARKMAARMEMTPAVRPGCFFYYCIGLRSKS